VCAQKHNFDLSSEGYVNLLVGNKTSSGDEQLMIQARRNFLSAWWYQPLISSVGTIIENYFRKNPLTILDLGCGEWRYMRALQTIRANTQDHYIGLDIAKYAVKIAAKKMSGTFIVGNAYAIPLADASCDLIVSIFSPFDEKELHRCLKPWWIALIVGPWPEHLYKFIELIRDTPHHHKSKSAEEKYTLLDVQEIQKLQIGLSLQSPAVQDLFMMTPYYRQAPKEKQDAILQLDALELTADFRIEVLKKV
jgi:23S rRNA (guanine745-N1)-methyltransferase